MQRKMTKSSLIISLSFVLTLFSMPYSWAENETSTSNTSTLNNFYYSNHTCGQKSIRPIKPASAESFKNVKEYNTAVANFNIKVSNYNAEIKFYKSCINRYIQNGNQDINSIKQRLDTALGEARSN
jgi:hypothetical protein